MTKKVIRKVGSGNKLVSAGETYMFRLFGIIHKEPEPLKDAFDLELKAPSSEGYKTFMYKNPSKA